MANFKITGYDEFTESGMLKLYGECTDPEAVNEPLQTSKDKRTYAIRNGVIVGEILVFANDLKVLEGFGVSRDVLKKAYKTGQTIPCRSTRFKDSYVWVIDQTAMVMQVLNKSSKGG